MDFAQIGVIVATFSGIAAIIFGVVNTRRNGKADDYKSGEQSGRIETTLKHMNETLDSMKRDISEMKGEFRAVLDKHTNDIAELKADVALLKRGVEL